MSVQEDRPALLDNNPNPDQFLVETRDHVEEEREVGKCAGCSSYLNALVLLIALSTHAIFEGIALGLTNELSATVNIMLGLLFHKGPAAMSLGISLSKKFKGDQ